MKPHNNVLNIFETVVYDYIGKETQKERVFFLCNPILVERPLLRIPLFT